jgi:mannose-6-phosphate isomerase-like protein (cupin superfamily)
MDIINGCTVVAAGPELVAFGPAETGQAYRTLIGALAPGQPGLPLHVHPHTDEAIHVASGECTCVIGDRELRLMTGGFVFVPRGTAHTAWNSGAGPMLGLVIISPGNAEHLVEPVSAG